MALVNKDLLPVRLTLPGADVVFLSQGLKYNMEWLLFKGPWAPFDKWHLVIILLPVFVKVNFSRYILFDNSDSVL